MIQDSRESMLKANAHLPNVGKPQEGEIPEDDAEKLRVLMVLMVSTLEQIGASYLLTATVPGADPLVAVGANNRIDLAQLYSKSVEGYNSVLADFLAAQSPEEPDLSEESNTDTEKE